MHNAKFDAIIESCLFNQQKLMAINAAAVTSKLAV